MNLNQVTIQVSDVERSIQFYEALGLELIVKSIPHYARFICPSGSTTFSLHKNESIDIHSNTWIYFETENLDEKIDQLMAKGFSIEEMPNDKPWLWREARINDPDHHTLIIYHAGSNRTDPPWRIRK